MSNEDKGLYTLTAPVRVVYPNLITPRAYQQKAGTEKYSGLFVFPSDHPDLKPMVALATSLAKEGFDGIETDELNVLIRNTFQSGAKQATAWEKANKNKKVGDFVKDKVIFKASSKFPVSLGAIVNGKGVDFKDEAVIKTNAKMFYSGVECLAQFKFKAEETPQGKFIVKYLQMVFSLNKGERLGEERSASEVFKGYAGAMTTEDPTAGLADLVN